MHELVNQYFPVLDYGFVALKDHMGSDADIEEAARVSYAKGTRKVNETRGLIRYLMANRHTSPLEQCVLKFHIGMPIFVMRQWVRHRTARLNEVSGRYSVLPQVFYTPDREHFTKQSASNKQGRSQEAATEEEYGLMIGRLKHSRCETSFNYDTMLASGIAKEIARIDLPLSIYTTIFWQMDLHNLFHFLSLRLDAHAQYEIRAYAEVIAGIVTKLFPLAWEAFVDYRLNASTLSRLDRELLDYYFLYISRSETDFDLLKDKATDLGMTQREFTDFWTKLQPVPKAQYPLDLSTTKPASHFEEIIQKHSKIEKV